MQTFYLKYCKIIKLITINKIIEVPPCSVLKPWFFLFWMSSIVRWMNSKRMRSGGERVDMAFGIQTHQHFFTRSNIQVIQDMGSLVLYSRFVSLRLFLWNPAIFSAFMCTGPKSFTMLDRTRNSGSSASSINTSVILFFSFEAGTRPNRSAWFELDLFCCFYTFN